MVPASELSGDAAKRADSFFDAQGSLGLAVASKVGSVLSMAPVKVAAVSGHYSTLTDSSPWPTSTRRNRESMLTARTAAV